MIRVLLVHDVCLFRWALAEVLSRENDIEVAVSTPEGAAGRVRALQPDVCVVDVDSAMPIGLSTLRKLSDSGAAPAAHADGTSVREEAGWSDGAYRNTDGYRSGWAPRAAGAHGAVVSGVGAAARSTPAGGMQTRTEAHGSAGHAVPGRGTPARGPIAHIPQQVNRCRELPMSSAAEAGPCGAEPGAGGGREGAAGPAKGPALLVLGSAHRPGPLRRAFEADALGFVDKEGSPGQLAVGIRQVAAGRRFVDGSLGFGFLQAAEMPLTQRELSVLTLAAEGASVAEIAGTLHLSNGTVRNYMSAITRKTGARNRVDAIRISQGEGWL